MRNNAYALIQILIEPLRITRREIYAPMATIGLVTSTAKRGLPSSIMKANRVTNKGHPVRNFRFVIFLSIRLVADQGTRALLVI